MRDEVCAVSPSMQRLPLRDLLGVMLDANATSYGRDDESRHLFHIGVTRAAYQLWLVATAAPSPLLAGA